MPEIKWYGKSVIRNIISGNPFSVPKGKNLNKFYEDSYYPIMIDWYIGCKFGRDDKILHIQYMASKGR